MTHLTILTTDRINPQDLPTVLAAVHQKTALSFLIADWWNGPGIFRDYAAGLNDLKAKAGDCISGCAFGPQAEVCWRQVGKWFRLTLVAEQDMSALLSAAAAGGAQWQSSHEPDRLEESEDIEIVLWGTECVDAGNPSTWIEARIPRPLSYPVIPAQSQPADHKNDFEAVFLKIKAYYDARGRPIIYRRYGLRAQLESQRRKQLRQAGRELMEEDEEIQAMKQGATDA